MKIAVTAVVTFECDTADADPELVAKDQAYEAAVLALPHDVSLEELLEWEPAASNLARGNPA